MDRVQPPTLAGHVRADPARKPGRHTAPRSGGLPEPVRQDLAAAAQRVHAGGLRDRAGHQRPPGLQAVDGAGPGARRPDVRDRHQEHPVLPTRGRRRPTVAVAGLLVGVKYTLYQDFPYDIGQASQSVRAQIKKAQKAGYTCRRADPRQMSPSASARPRNARDSTSCTPWSSSKRRSALGANTSAATPRTRGPASRLRRRLCCTTGGYAWPGSSRHAPHTCRRG